MIRKLFNSTSVTSIALAAAFALPLTGCPAEEQGPIEKLEDSAEEVGDDVEDAFDRDGPLEEGAEKLDEAADDLQEGVDDATDELKN